MKSLVFNLLVVGALAFLLFDGKPPESVRDAMDKVAAKAGHMIETGKDVVGKQMAEPEQAPMAASEPETRTETPEQDRADAKAVAVAPAVQAATPAPKPKPAPAKPVEAQAAESPANPAPNPAAPTRIAAAPAPNLDPAVAKRRAEILGTAPRTDAGPTEPTPEFMTPRVRRAELHRLAEDMELLFVDKASR